MRSRFPINASSRSMPSSNSPLITLKYDTSPRCGSTSVLYMKRVVGASCLQTTSSPSLVNVLVISGDADVLIVNSIRRFTPISFLAERQNTGSTLPARIPTPRPLRISSSVREPASKNFSISVSSYSAAVSISVWRRSSASSLRFSGISRSSLVPFSSLK